MSHAPTTRRTALAMLGATIALPAAATGRKVSLIVGTYAQEGGKGLYRVFYDATADQWELSAPVTGIADASFGVGGGPAGAYYLVREGREGTVTAYSPSWSPLGTTPTRGADPCFLAIDPASRCLAVANYSSGSVAFHRIDPRSGVPDEPTVFQHQGKGPNASRQQGPHAHWVGFSPDRRWLHSVDLGADAIFAYRFDPGARALSSPVIAWRAPSGAGPRHMIHHPRLPCAYVVCELSNTLVTLDARDGGFTTRQTASTLPAGYAGASQAAHIAINKAGTRLYVSNRGHDSIAVFALDAAGAPTLIQHVASGGSWPRLFRLLEGERRVVVANEHSGTLAVLQIMPDGRLTPTQQRLAIPGIAFIDVVARA